ncbi:unnamed protein product [Sympodiomycopsis kandeliae]
MSTESQRIILVTGANSGIGLELVSQLLSDKRNHVVAGVRSKEKGEAMSSTLKALNRRGSFEPIILDVSKDSDIDAAVNTLESSHGRVDALVSNAAVASFPEGTPLSVQMNTCFAANATGPAVLTEKLLPLLKKSKETVRVVNVSSGAGSINIRLNESGPMHKTPGLLQYRASKAALNMVTAEQHVFLSEFGCKVFAYCPGYCVSNLSSKNTAEYGAKPTSEGVKPIIDLLNGKRDEQSGGFVHENGNYPW